MKKIIGLVVAVVLLFSQAVFADEEFSVWASQTFVPQGGQPTFSDKAIIAISPVITNPNDFSSLNVVLRYESFIPDAKDGPVSYNVYAIIEAQFLVGEWTPIHNQVNGINSFEDAPFRILTIVPEFTITKEPGNNYTINFGSNKLSQVSVVGGHLIKGFRIVLRYDDPDGTTPLQSIRLSAYGRKFGREFVPAGQP